ncbi:MAG: S-layer family protein [Planctomyces sp.]|nr:S-layer family protein [Planctomyces sp.]
MYLSGFIRRMRGIFRQLISKPQPGHRTLRLVQLEDRRVLNASVAVNAGIVLSGAETLTIENGGSVDFGGGDVQAVRLTLNDGSTWSVAGLNATEFSVNTNELLVDASLFADGGDMLTGGNVLLIQGSDAATDQVVLDLTGIDFIPSGGISFLGGEDVGNADNDSLAITGYNIAIDANPLTADVTVTHTGLESGNVVLNGLGTVEFDQIEPLALGGTAADLVINLPAGADPNVILSDDGNLGNSITRLSGDTFELTDFANPTSSLTINDAGNVKQIFIQGLDPAFDADLTVNDDAGSDNVVTFDAADTDLGTGNLVVNGDIINITRAITTEGGSITLNADTLVSSSAAGDLQTTAAVSSGVASGAIDINVTGNGVVDLLGDLITEGADHAAGNGSNGGAVTIDTADGTIDVGLIRTSGGDDLANANTGGTAGLITLNTGNSNLITLTDDLTAAGGAGGTLGAGNNITLSDAVVLADDISVSSGTTAGNVRFDSTIEGTAAGTEDLSVTAGTGNVVFNGAVGGVTRLGNLTVNSATNVTAAALTVAALQQVAGSGLTTLNGVVNTNTAAGVSLSGTNLAINNSIVTASAGGVTINVSGTTTIAAAGDIDSDGAVSITATGGISSAGDVDTTNDNVTYESPLILTGDVDINTGAGGGTVAFNNTVNGTAAGSEDLTITAGTGNVTFVGAVGGTVRLGVVTINSATNVTAAGLTVASLNQVAGSGLTTLGGAVNTNTAAGVSLTGTNLALNNSITTTANGPVTLNMSGTVVISANGDINSDGAVAITGSGGITTAGDIDTTNDNITINNAVTLTGSIDFDTTGAAAGNIRFLSTVATAGNNLNLDAGAVGNVTLDGNVTGGGNLVVRNGAVQNYSGLSVASVDIQNSATSVNLNGAVTVTSNAANGGTDALKINAAGIVQILAPITATAAAGLNVDIDPTDVSVDANITATGQIDITASNNISVAAVTVRSDTDGNGGTLTITADDDNSGAGDLTAVDGSTLRGHTVTLSAFNIVTDVVTSNVGNLTATAGNDITINDVTTASTAQIQLSARRNIQINANITASTTAQLTADSDGNGTGSISGTAGIVTGTSVILNAAQGIGDAGAIQTNAGQWTATNTTSGQIRLSEVAAGGSVTLNAINNGNRDVTLDTANGSMTDGNGAVTNITAGNATITAVNGSIGATSSDVFKGTFDPIEVNLTGNLNATAATGTVAISGTVGGTTTINATTGFVQSAANLNVAGDVFTVTNLALITTATLTIADAGFTIAGDLRIEAANVEAVTANEPVILGTAATPVSRLLYRVSTANDEVVQIRSGQVDIETGTSVQMQLLQDTQFTDLDCDLTSLDTTGNTAVIQSVGAVITQGSTTGTVPVTQTNDRILSLNLLLLGDGPFTLNNLNNNVTTLAGSANGAISFRDTNTLVVGTVSQIFPVVAVAGVETLAGNSAITINVDSGDLTVNALVTANGNGNVTLAAGGNVSLGAIVSSTSGNLMVTADADSNNSGAIIDSLPDTDGGTLGEQGVNLVTSGTAFLSAAEGIGSADDIDTTVGSLQATNTATNSVNIQETNGLTINGTGVRTLAGNGSITVDVVAGGLAVNSVVSANGAGVVTLNAADSIQIGATVSSGSGTLNLAADSDLNNTGSITDTLPDTDGGTAGEQGLNLSTTGTAVLIAAEGIGAGDDIDTSIGLLIATNTTSGDIVVQEVNGLTIGGTGVRTLAGSGNITVNVTTGDLLVNSVVTANGAGTVLLTAGGSVSLGALVSSGSGNLTIAADADGNNTGAITDTLPDTDGGTLGEQGVNLQTTGTAFLSAAQGIGAGDDVDTTVTTLEATNTTSGAIVIQETNELIIGGTGVRTLGGNGDINVDVVVGNLVINSVVSANGNGFVTLSAVESISIGATVSSGSGTLNIIADSDLSNTGAIVDTLPDTDAGTAGEQGLNLSTSGTAILTAAEGIGSIDDIDTSIGILVAINRAINNISVQEVNGLIISGAGVITQAGNGNIAIDVVAGDLAVNSVVTAHGAGSVSLNAAGSVFLGALVSSTTGNLSVVADSDVNATGAIVDTLPDTDGGTAGEQGVNLRTGAAVTLTAAQGIGAADDIDTDIVSLQATNSTTGRIDIQELNTLVINGTGVRTLGGNGDVSVDVVAGNLTIDSVVTANGTGNARLNSETGTADINAQVSSGAGDITVTANVVTQDANITTGGTGRISVLADTGAIVMANGVRTTANQGSIRYETTAGNIIAEDMLTQGGAIHIDAAGDVSIGNATSARIEATGVIFSALTVNAAAGTSIITLADTSGFSVGQTVFIIDDNSPAQSFVINATTATTLTLSGLLGSAYDVANNARVALQADNPGVMTLVTTNVGAGSTTVNVQSTAGLSVGQTIYLVDDSFLIADNSRAESFTITGISGNQITLNRASTSTYQTARNAVLSTGQIISIQASGNIAVQSGSQLTTDNNPVAGSSEEDTGDRIRVLSNGGTGTVAFGLGVNLRTDGGVATTFQQRPNPAGGAGARSFFNYPASPILAMVASLDALTYNAEFAIQIQTPGEENLRLDIDWRDASGDGLVTERIESFYLQPGLQSISHVYSFFDLQSFLDNMQATFLLDFSVSHHESIQVLGGTIQQNGFSSNVNVGPVPGLSFNAGLLTTTDDLTTGLAAPLSPGVVIDRSFAVVNSLALSNADFFFEGGTVEIKIPTLLFPPINTPKPIVQLVADAVSLGTASIQPLLFMPATEFEPSPLGTFSTQSEDIFRLRRVDASGLFDVPGYERIREGSNLLHPELLRQWVSEQDLGGASNYELWLITRKRDENGNEVSVERPLLRFDIVNKRPFPASEETLPDDIPQLMLETVEEVAPETPQAEQVPGAEPKADGQVQESEKVDPATESTEPGKETAPGSDSSDESTSDDLSFRLDNLSATASTVVGVMVSRALQQGRRRGGVPVPSRISSVVSGVLRNKQAGGNEPAGLSETEPLRDIA